MTDRDQADEVLSSADSSSDPRPRSRLTLPVRRDVLLDKLAYRAANRLIARPDAAEMERIGGEIEAAVALFADRGWSADPATYHEVPTPAEAVRAGRRRSGNIRYTSISWLDGYAPRPEEPGAPRFTDYPKNHVARAALLEHRTRDRPWLVCIHGFGMGNPGLDLHALRALRFHRDLDLNVALLTLPFHGRRSPVSVTKPLLPSADVMDTVHGFSQAVWDTRQLLALLRQRTDQPISLMGVSLGGLVSSIVASVAEPDAVVLVVPAIDIPAVFMDALSETSEEDEVALQLLELARPLYAPVSPLHLSPKVPVDRRFIVAGTLDQFLPPSAHAVELWRHWDEPALHWYHGGHASFFWNGSVQPWIEASLRGADLA